MPYTLTDLVRVGGNAPPNDGDGFDANVPGSVGGDNFSSYKVTDWSFGGDVPNPSSNYSDGHVFDMTINFTQGARASNIKHTGNVILLEELTGGPGVSQSTVSSSIVGGSTGSTVDVTAKAPFSSNQTPQTPDVWFSGYSEPDIPGHSGEEEVRFTPVLSGGSTAAVPCSFLLAYVVDARNSGTFNPDLEELFEYNMFQREATIFDWEWEWHNNSSYTDLYSQTTQLFETGSVPSTVWTFYLRGRRSPAHSWVNYGAVTWTDPR